MPPGRGLRPAEHHRLHKDREHAATREHLPREKINLYIHSVPYFFFFLHKLEATLGGNGLFLGTGSWAGDTDRPWCPERPLCGLCGVRRSSLHCSRRLLAGAAAAAEGPRSPHGGQPGQRRLHGTSSGGVAPVRSAMRRWVTAGHPLGATSDFFFFFPLFSCPGFQTAKVAASPSRRYKSSEGNNGLQ